MSRYLPSDPERDERARIETEIEHLEGDQAQLQRIGANLTQAAHDIAELKDSSTREKEFFREANATLDRTLAALDKRADGRTP